MMKIVSKNISYILIIVLSFILHYLFKDSSYYFYVKYITTFRAIDIMYSIIFSFLFFKVYLDKYYYYVLNRNSIITRLGKKKYLFYISKKILTNTIFLFIINLIIDFIFTNALEFKLLLSNIIITMIIMIILPKKREYNNELLIIIGIVLLIKLIIYKIII